MIKYMFGIITYLLSWFYPNQEKSEESKLQETLILPTVLKESQKPSNDKLLQELKEFKFKPSIVSPSNTAL